MPESKDPKALADIPLFRGLTSGEFSDIAGQLRHKSFRAGSSVVLAEQSGEAVYLIGSGAAKVTAEQADGSEVILAILSTGDVIGEMSISENLPRSATVTTLDECQMWWLPQKTFQTFLVKYPSLSMNLVRLLSQRLRLANEQIQALATKDVEGRVARQLVSLVTAFGTKAPSGEYYLPLRLTQSDIAALTGATRERVNQVMASYKQRNFLSVDKNHHITVHNWKALVSRTEQ